MPPVRTGLDDRLDQLRAQLVDDANELMRIYAISTKSLATLNQENIDHVLEARNEARKIFWERTGDILLVLSLNQPMMGDLRMISTFLRGTDVIERGMRHARDISQTTALLARDLALDSIPQELSVLIGSMNDSLLEMISSIFNSIGSKSSLDVHHISDKWEEISTSWEACQDIISTTPGTIIGSKTGRLNLFRAISRMERTGYNFVRFADHWHHALNNEWISIEG